MIKHLRSLATGSPAIDADARFALALAWLSVQTDAPNQRHSAPPMLTVVDYAIIGIYFLFMSGLGWFFRKRGENSSDYFRGGGRMPWWLVGCSIFMTSFSAWTFTGAAGLAFEGGLVVLLIYWSNAAGLVASALFFAPMLRQTRVITATEAIRQRLGLFNQQFLLWLGMPLSIVRSAIWLYGLAIFLSPVFNLDMTTIIVVCGFVVVSTSMLGGSWAATTGDLMQALLLMPVTLVAAWFACDRIGGVGALIDSLPPSHFDLTASSLPGFGAVWIVALLLEKLFAFNTLNGAGRYLSVSDSAGARKAAWLAAALFVLGSFVWFVPPLVARGLQLDLATLFPSISVPAEAAYAAIALQTMPPGLLGLLVTGLIAATMSSMDSGLNGNAGTFVRGVYRPLLRPQAPERELVLAARLSTLVMGSLIVLLALKYSTWHNLGAFTIMFNMAAMLTTPTAVPLCWCLLARRSPDWAAWSSMIVGFLISLSLGWLPRQTYAADWMSGMEAEELIDWLRTNEYATILIANTVVCSLWFWGATLLRGPAPSPRRAEVEAFFEAVDTPVSAEHEPAEQSTKASIGRLCLCYGLFLAAAACFPNELRGHAGLAFCAVFFLVVFLALKRKTSG